MSHPTQSIDPNRQSVARRGLTTTTASAMPCTTLTPPASRRPFVASAPPRVSATAPARSPTDTSAVPSLPRHGRGASSPRGRGRGRRRRRALRPRPPRRRQARERHHRSGLPHLPRVRRSPAGGVPGTATYKAKCMEDFGRRGEPSSETVYNADVYGQVKDNANDDVLNSGRWDRSPNSRRDRTISGCSSPSPTLSPSRSNSRRSRRRGHHAAQRQPQPLRRLHRV